MAYKIILASLSLLPLVVADFQMYVGVAQGAGRDFVSGYSLHIIAHLPYG